MLEFHACADIFPLLEGAAFEELVADIREHGLREEIVVEGERDAARILDGRNRYRALVALGRLDPAAGAWRSAHVLHDGFREFGSEAGESDALAFVISKNLRRRHLTESQRAMVAGRLATLRPGRPAGGASGGPSPGPSPRDASRGGGEQDGDKAANLPGFRQEQAGALLNVSERSVRHAREVIDHGVPGLADAVTQGKVKVSAAAAIATLEPVEQEAALVAVGSPEWKASVKAARDAQTATKKARRAIRERALGEKQKALPQEKFGVIYADPEWRYKTWSEAGMDRSPDNHYPTSATEVIMDRPVHEIRADDCVLFLWATVPMLEDALTVMKAWGFAYKSHFVWVKDGGPGTGKWNRNGHETLLVGTRGNVPCPADGTQWGSVITAPKGRHSAKPDEAYELIEAFFPSLPKIELNARCAREGWVAWGNEAPEAGDGDQGSVLSDEAGVGLTTDDRHLTPGAAA